MDADPQKIEPMTDIDDAHKRKLTRCLKKARNLVRSRIKARKGLGKRRYR